MNIPEIPFSLSNNKLEEKLTIDLKEGIKVGNKRAMITVRKYYEDPKNQSDSGDQRQEVYTNSLAEELAPELARIITNRISEHLKYADVKVYSDAQSDPKFWQWFSDFLEIFATWVVVPQDGGLALQTACKLFFANPLKPIPTFIRSIGIGKNSQEDRAKIAPTPLIPAGFLDDLTHPSLIPPSLPETTTSTGVIDWEQKYTLTVLTDGNGMVVEPVINNIVTSIPDRSIYNRIPVEIKEPLPGYVFFKWEIVEGPVEIGERPEDIFLPATTAILKSGDGTIKAIFKLV